MSRSSWLRGNVDLIVLLALSLAVRLAYVASIRGDVLFELPRVDGQAFWEAGLALARGEGGEPVFYRPPLFSHVLALLIRILGESAGGARWALSILSSLAAPMTTLYARPLLGRRWSSLPGFLVALYGPAVFFGGELLAASTVLLLNLLALLVLARAERSGYPRWFAGAGLAIGVSALARPTILLFALMLLFRYRRTRRSLAALAIGVAIGISPATLHNLAGGDLVPVSSNGGINFYIGNHQGADGRSARAPELPAEPKRAQRAATVIAQAERGQGLRPSAVSRFWFSNGLSWIGSSPGGWASLTFRRVYFSLNDREISDNIDPRAVREQSAVLRALPVGQGLLVGLSMAGILALRRRPEGSLLLLYALATAIPLWMFFVVGRFRLPLLAFTAIGGAAGVQLLRARWRESFRSAALPTAAVVVGMVVSFSSLFGVDADTTWHYHSLCGDAHFRRGEPDLAIDAYEESLRHDPSRLSTRNALAFLYAETGQRLDRAEELARSTAAPPTHERRYYLDTLGWVLFKKGDLEESARVFRESMSLYAPSDPGRSEPMLHLALVLRAQGQEPEARSLEQEARRLMEGDR